MHKLSDAEGYLRGVIGNIVSVHKTHGTAVVHIGITGTGFAPHYRISPKSDWLPDDEGINIHDYFVAFHGRSHDRLEWGLGELRGDHWSLKHMTWEEVRALLGEICA